jgi:hypothetical protein
MINHSVTRHALALQVSLALAAVLPAAALAATSTTTLPPDSGLFTSYSLGPSAQSVNWLVCGSTQQTEGCYDLGKMGQFGQVAAMMEGAAAVKAATGTVTREIYVCDVAAGSGTGVTLYDYTKTDVVSATDDAATVVLKKAIPLTLIGGANAACEMAASATDVYVEVGGGYADVYKNGDVLEYSQSNEGVTSITADAPGNVDVDYSSDQFTGIEPYEISGGGNYFKVGTTVGVSLVNEPSFNGTFPADRMKVAPKRRGAASAAATQTVVDSGLFTDYSASSGGTSISFLICGTTAEEEGCFGSGGFGTFNHAGSIIEGFKSYSGAGNDTVTRHIYICDDAAGASGTGVTLYDYKRTDVIDSFDTDTVTLAKTVPLPLVGGANANCSMSEDGANLFVGTQNSSTAVKVVKGLDTFTAVAGLDPGLHFATATANNYGFAAMTFGSTNGSSDVNEFSPTGNPVQSTGGAYFLLNTANAVQTLSFPTTTIASSVKLLNVQLKKPAL